jgi:hypothetical protein
MQKAFRVFLACTVCAVLFLIPVSLLAQASSGLPADAGQQAPPQDTQAVSQTGVLPQLAVQMNFDSMQVDGAAVPSSSANSGVDDTFQRAWEALRPGGFSTILFKVDLKDPQAAARVANLCIWAKANNVALIPVLANAAGSDGAASFPGAVISLLRGGDGQQFAAYTQIAYFQIEDPINIPLATAGRNPAETQKKLLAVVDSLRNAESQALQGTGVQATPIIVSASFDYELIQQGAIAGVPLDAAAEQKAQAAFKKTLLPIASAANVDAINVTWFPRSITAGDEGHFVGLLQNLESGVPGKKLLLDTGFSTAFNSGDQQSQFMTLTLTNLAGFRASDGADSRFQGITISQAFDTSSGKAQTLPAGASDPSQWDWNEKARQLAQMWSQGKKSAELTWWLEKVRAGRALLNTSGGTDMVATPGLQAIQQFSGAVAQVSQNITPEAIPSAGQTTPSTPDATGAPAAADPSQVPDPSAANGALSPSTGSQAAGPSTPGFYSQMLQTLVQQVTTQLTNAMVTKLTNKLTSSSSSQSQYPGYGAQNGAPSYAPPPDAGANYSANSQYSTTPGASPPSSGAGMISLGPEDVTLDSANPAPGQTVQITAQLHNGAPQDVYGLTVQLLDSGNPGSPQASQSGITVPPSGVFPVQLTWTAGQPTGTSSTLLVQVLDASGTPVASAGVPTITVAAANGGTMSNTAPNDPNSGSSNTAGQTGQNGTPGNSAANGGATANGFSPAGTLTAVVQPQIVYFGPVVTAGPKPSLSLQVTNPAATLVRSAQAQLFVDGKPGPVQTLGPLLPSQTRSATFNNATVPAGTHSVKVVVTTTDGASATATASPAALPGSSHSANSTQPQQTGARSGVPVRTGLASGFRIGTVTTVPVSATPLAGRASVGLARAGTAAPVASTTGSLNPAGYQSRPTSTIASLNPVNSPAAATSNPVAGSSQTGNAIAPGTRIPRQPTVQTILPPGSSPTNQVGTVSTVLPPTGSSQTTGVRTALPQVPVRANPTGNVTTVLPPASASPTPGVRTALPPRTSAPSQATTVATVLPLGGSSTGLAARTVVPPGSGTTQTTTVATVLPPRPGPGTVAPSTGMTQTGTATTVLPGRGLPGQPATANSTNGRAYLDLSVTSAEIRFRPAAPGQPTTFTAVVHNLGTAPAQNASVVFMLNADGRIMTSRPSVFNIAAGGSFLASWTTPIPAGQSVQLAVQVTANGDTNPANNQAVIRLH